MNNEEVLQKTINILLERIARQTAAYESEIANLNAKIIVLNSKQEDSLSAKSRTTKQTKIDES